tara:strand:+ start:5511 stop:6302 length:792 start_codon:yes stop_codon:yes gene_type:complete
MKKVIDFLIEGIDYKYDVKPIGDVKKGDIATDYNDEEWEVLEIGNMEDLEFYDDSGAAQEEIESEETVIAVTSQYGNAVYRYDDEDGATVRVPKEKEGNPEALKVFKALPEFDSDYRNMANQIQNDSKKNFAKLLKDKFDSKVYIARNLHANSHEDVMWFELYNKITNEVYYIKAHYVDGYDKSDKIVVHYAYNKDYNPTTSVYTQTHGKIEQFDVKRKDLDKYKKYFTTSGSGKFTHYFWGVADMGLALDFIKKKHKNIKIK